MEISNLYWQYKIFNLKFKCPAYKLGSGTRGSGNACLEEPALALPLATNLMVVAVFWGPEVGNPEP